MGNTSKLNQTPTFLPLVCMTAGTAFRFNSPPAVINQTEHERGQKADRAEWKEGQVAEMEQTDKKAGQSCSYTARQMSSEAERQETNWGRRVRSSTRKHKYLIKARLTGEQRVQRA